MASVRRPRWARGEGGGPLRTRAGLPLVTRGSARPAGTDRAKLSLRSPSSSRSPGGKPGCHCLPVHCTGPDPFTPPLGFSRASLWHWLLHLAAALPVPAPPPTWPLEPQASRCPLRLRPLHSRPGPSAQGLALAARPLPSAFGMSRCFVFLGTSSSLPSFSFGCPFRMGSPWRTWPSSGEYCVLPVCWAPCSQNCGPQCEGVCPHSILCSSAQAHCVSSGPSSRLSRSSPRPAHPTPQRRLRLGFIGGAPWVPGSRYAHLDGCQLLLHCFYCWPRSAVTVTLEPEH